jgi:hypothetical protein
MDYYTITRLYHKAVQQWWSLAEDRDEYQIELNELGLESLFTHLFSSFPPTVIILLSSNGKVSICKSMEETPPRLFRTCRYMKIDNQTSSASISSIMNVFYQLMSIDSSEPLCIMDYIALLKYIMLLISEHMNIDFSLCSCFSTFRRGLFQGPDFLPDREMWKRRIRDPLLSHFFDSDLEKALIGYQEVNLTRLNECYTLIEKVNQMIELQEERLDLYFEALNKFKPPE